MTMRPIGDDDEDHDQSDDDVYWGILGWIVIVGICAAITWAFIEAISTFTRG